MAYRRELDLMAARTDVELVPRKYPSLDEAKLRLDSARQRLDDLIASGSRQEARTAECDWFGAEHTYTLAGIAMEDDGARLHRAIAERSPAEIQVVGVGPWAFVGWPGEVFVEFSLALESEFSDTFVIAYANGETHSYLVTQQAIDEKAYESQTAIFQSPESGNRLVEASRRLLNSVRGRRAARKA